jgi:sphinganine C4-monooxygenase
MASNVTVGLFPPGSFSPKTPLYYSDALEFLPGVSDHILATFAPIVAYWLVSGFFHALDCSSATLIARYRIHESPEVLSRNRVTRGAVLRAVLFQQVVQVTLAYFWMDSTPHDIRPQDEMSALADSMRAVLGRLVGHGAAYTIMKAGGPGMVWATYWWLIPVVQFFIAMCVLSLSARAPYAHLTPPAGSSSIPGSTSSTVRCT